MNSIKKKKAKFQLINLKTYTTHGGSLLVFLPKCKATWEPVV